MIRRAIASILAAASTTLAVPGVAMAQEPSPPPEPPPVANCDPFSSIVCQVPVTVNIGPIPVDIGSIFSPPPATP